MFSQSLARILRRGAFPLFSISDLALWSELVRALTTDFDRSMQEIKHLYDNDDAGSFLDRWAVTRSGQRIEISSDDKHAFLGAAYARLTQDHGILVSSQIVHGLAVAIRNLAVNQGLVAQSEVTLAPNHTQHGMGTGLVTTDTLTFVPDPSLPIVNSFGSTPDQAIIAGLAPVWAILKKRRHVGQHSGAIGRKPHYVLAHLLNHNVNGSGASTQNVVPFSADGNTRMARAVENDLKEFVQRGAPVKYRVEVGPDIGMTPGRQAALGACTTAEEREIVQMEQYLPKWLKITLQAQDTTGVWHMIHNAVQIDNFVPEDVPVT